MDNMEEILQELGLSQGESKVYLALLQVGSAGVSTIQRCCKLHRTNIYDYLEQLQNKGLTSMFVQSGVRKYSAAKPEKLQDFLREKQDLLSENLKFLQKLAKETKQEIIVEVYKGKEGGKLMLREIIDAGENYVCFNLDEKYWEENFAHETRRHYRAEKRKGIRGRVLISDEAETAYKDSDYRYVPQEYFSPSPVVVYGDTVCTIILDPLTFIMTRNAAHADAQKKHFEYIWKDASTSPKSSLKVMQ